MADRPAERSGPGRSPVDADTAPRPGTDRGAPSVPFRLEGLVLRELRLPLVRPFRISSGVVSERRILLLELLDEDGATGWSECVAQERPNYSPETLDTAWWAIREWLAPRVLGRSFGGPAEVAAPLAAGVRGHPMAKAAVEMGCWELAARRAGESLTRLLGGTRRRVQTGISLGIQETPEALADRVRAARREGYARIKVKIEPGSDRRFLAAAREELGPEVPLMADANASYAREDADRLASLDEFGLLMLEQPLHPDEMLRHADLQERLETPLCLDESISSPRRAEEMVRLGAGRIVNVKPGRVGGFAPSLRIHDLCRAHGLAVWCGGMLESGVGRAHNVALASLPGFVLPGDLSASRRYWEEDVVEPEWTVDEESRVAVPVDRPGMGVEVRRDRVEGLTVREETLTAG